MSEFLRSHFEAVLLDMNHGYKLMDADDAMALLLFARHLKDSFDPSQHGIKKCIQMENLILHLYEVALEACEGNNTAKRNIVLELAEYQLSIEDDEAGLSAEKNLQKLLKYDPHNIIALRLYIMALDTNFKFSKIIKKMEDLPADSPLLSDDQALGCLCSAYWKKKRFDDALRVIEHALSLFPNNDVLQDMHDSLKEEIAASSGAPKPQPS